MSPPPPPPTLEEILNLNFYFLGGTFHLKYKEKQNNNPEKLIYHVLNQGVLNLFLTLTAFSARAGNKKFERFFQRT